MKNPIIPPPDRKPSWRERYRVHPCAEVFPRMPEGELNALAEDIKAHGLSTPVTLWEDSSGGRWLLDGRTRLEASERAGIELELPTHIQVKRSSDGVDPAAFVISANIHRRHLTKEQQAMLILKAIEAAGNDQTARVRSFSPEAGKRGGSTKDPILERAVNEASKHGISRSTVKNARRKAEGKTGTARTVKTSAPKATSPSACPKCAALKVQVASLQEKVAKLQTENKALKEMDAWLGKLGGGNNGTIDNVVYRRLSKKYHPDINPNGAQVMADIHELIQSFKPTKANTTSRRRQGRAARG